MSVSLSPQARCQFNQGGIPLAGGKLFTYAAGTTTKLATYTDSTGGTPNQNPIILDANGQCDIWLTDNVAYKFVLSPSTDTDPPTNAYWTKDNISNVPSANPQFTSVTVSGNVTVGGTINKVTITQPATSATLTIANLKTLTASNTLTFSGTDGASVAFGAGGTVGYTGSPLSQFAATTSAQLLGVISDATGTGKAVFATDPTLTLSDLTTNNVSATAHGWCPKLSNDSSTFLNGLGAWASTAVLQNVVRSARTSNTILGAADKATLIDVTSGTFTQTFTAAATLGSGWYCWYRNSGTGDVTLDPNASETIDGLTSFAMYGQEARLIVCDGTSFYSIIIHPFYRKATSTFTFTMPPGYLEIEVDLVAAGGGGGAGARGAAATGRLGGGPGGAPARAVRKFRNLTAGGATTVTIGAGGTGGAAQSVDTSNGADGITGGDTSFGALLSVKGGVGGKGGTAAGGTPGAYTSGSGLLTAGVAIAASGAAPGGAPNLLSFGVTAVNSLLDNPSEGGAGCANGVASAGFHSIWGGASSAVVDMSTTTVANSGSSLMGVSAATAGCGITGANTMPATAGRAGLNGTVTAGGGAIGGSSGASPTVGANGADAATDDACGNPGAGGGATITASTAAKAGGNGGFPGGPGGGGGAVLNGSLSGAGGNGGNGRAIIKGVV